MQKVRLGAVDGLNFAIWNSFIYQEKHSLFEDFYREAGSSCTPNKKREYEFAWNGFNIEATTPVSGSVSLFTYWAFSEAGWFIKEVGIKTFAKGNGDDGTLIIPVSIGGAAVFDYRVTSGSNLVCNHDTNRIEYNKVWDAEGYSGPIVSIGVDYRWK